MNKSVSIFILIAFPLVMLSALFWFLHVKNERPTDRMNETKEALDFQDNTLACPQCHMYLVGKKQTAQVITSDKKTHFFDDIGCAILWLKEKHIEPNETKIWVFSNDSLHYIDALNAQYATDEATPMQYGFGAYETPKDGTISFEQMRFRMLRGETMHDPKIRQHLKGH